MLSSSKWARQAAGREESSDLLAGKAWEEAAERDLIFQSVYRGEQRCQWGPERGRGRGLVRAPSPMSHSAGYRPVDSNDSMSTILITVIYDVTMLTALHSCFPC